MIIGFLTCLKNLLSPKLPSLKPSCAFPRRENKGVIILKIKSLLFVIMFLSLGTTGCSTTNEEFPPSMKGVVSVNGTEYELAKGGYRWERKKGLTTEVVTTDAASPNQIAENLDPIEAEPDQTMTIEVEDDPELSVFLWNEVEPEEEIVLNGNEFTGPASAGRYIYEVLAKWPKGEVSYTFVVAVD